MSQRVVHHARSNAELRGMISRLLSPDQLRAMAAAPDLEGVLRLLSETPYRASLSGQSDRDATAATVERALATSLMDAYQRTRQTVGGEGDELIATMERRIEVDNLKTMLRAKARDAPPAVIRPLIAFLGRMRGLPVEELLRAENPDAVAAALAGTAYGDVLRNALHRWVDEKSLFPVEIALDIHYYRQLWAAVLRLPATDCRLVGRIMGVRYDTLNLDWIIRYRLIYSLSPEAVFNYTLPHGWRVDDGVVRRAALAEGFDGIVAALPDPYHSLLLKSTASPDPVEKAELILRRYLVTVSRLFLSGYPFHLGVAVAFLFLKEAEVHDLRVVIEGKHGGRPTEWVLGQVWGIG